MLCRFIICLIFKLFLVVCVPGHKLVQPGPPEFCLKTNSFHINDEYHKEVPSPEESDIPVCQSWKEYSCCTRALTDTLSHSKTQGLYNFTRELCGRPLSPLCAEYFRVRTRTVRYLPMVTLHYGEKVIKCIPKGVNVQGAHTHIYTDSMQRHHKI